LSASNFSSARGVDDQSSVMLVGLGHGAIHWVAATYILLMEFIRTDLGLTYLETTFFGTVFYIASFSTNLFSGPVIDLFGRRVFFQGVSLVIGAVALALFMVTRDYVLLCALIAIIGMSNNLWHPAAISFLSSRHPNSRGYVLAVHASGASLGDLIAPAVVGALMAWLGMWQTAAAIATVPVFVVAAIIFIFLLPKDTPLEKQEKPEGSSSLSGYFSGFSSAFQNRLVLGLALMAGFRSMAQTGLLIFVPLYVASRFSGDALAMGAAMSTMQIGGFVAGLIAGTVSDAIGRKPIVLGGTLSTTLVILALAFIDNQTVFVVGVAILGFFLYAIRPVVHSWLMDMVPPHLGGSATSVLFGSQSILSTLTPIFGGLIADTYGLVYVFYFLAALMLISNLIAMTLPKSLPPADSAETA
jgi:FSR family fosmidomycin resistance protein-like MFS transporter